MCVCVCVCMYVCVFVCVLSHLSQSCIQKLLSDLHKCDTNVKYFCTTNEKGCIHSYFLR